MNLKAPDGLRFETKFGLIHVIFAYRGNRFKIPGPDSSGSNAEAVRAMDWMASSSAGWFVT
jgi:hypothetical protein